MPTVRNLTSHEFNLGRLDRVMTVADVELTDEEWAQVQDSPYIELVNATEAPAPPQNVAPAPVPVETPEQLRAEAQHLLDEATAEESKGNS
jgi:hypothetical protein